MTKIQINAGITTIHLLITLAVLSILLLNAVSGFTQLTRYYDIISDTQQLQHLFKQAKQQALLQARTIYTNITVGADWCVIVTPIETCTCHTPTQCLDDSDADGDGDGDGNSMTMKLQSAPDTSTTLVNHSFAGNRAEISIAFPPIAALTASMAGTLRLENSHYYSGIVLSSLGRVRQCQQVLPRHEAFTC